MPLKQQTTQRFAATEQAAVGADDSSVGADDSSVGADSSSEVGSGNVINFDANSTGWKNFKYWVCPTSMNIPETLSKIGA